MERWKNKKAILGVGLIVVLMVIFMPAHPISAQENLEYAVLAPLPGVAENAGDTTTLEKYVPAIFKLAIGLSAVAAVVMIVIGGFQYMTSDAIQGKSAGKERIKNAIYGLILVIAAWLILNEINPNLLNINLNIESATVTAPAGTLGTTDQRCQNCVPIPSQLAVKSGAGSTISEDMAPKLLSFDLELEKVGISDWTITEAYPPTRTHQSSCHAYGTCIDARSVPDADVYDFISAASNAGLKAVYEVESESRKNAVISASCGSNQTCKSTLGERIGVYPGQITAEHFSVYNNP